MQKDVFGRKKERGAMHPPPPPPPHPRPRLQPPRLPPHKHKYPGASPGEFIPEEMRCHLPCKGEITIVENKHDSSVHASLASLSGARDGRF
ncbi:hypothetical protein EYF80_011202 [Liparis tanakae]|uniref:Uncharacterized protein n=1 Tax=Liparis tanakae TaxID=230148 RepID=A0A4Z2ILH0_9TELE|nr:hypothetical protein EYF80_011202 [Liparis tanakae]